MPHHFTHEYALKNLPVLLIKNAAQFIEPMRLIRKNIQKRTPATIRYLVRHAFKRKCIWLTLRISDALLYSRLDSTRLLRQMFTKLRKIHSRSLAFRALIIRKLRSLHPFRNLRLELSLAKVNLSGKSFQLLFLFNASIHYTIQFPAFISDITALRISFRFP